MYYRYNFYFDPSNPYGMPGAEYYTNDTCDGVTIYQHWAQYDAAIQSVVNSAAAHKMYIILDVHGSGDPTTGDPVYNMTPNNSIFYSMTTPYTPNATVEQWCVDRLAKTYGDNPFVIFEPYNELWRVGGGNWLAVQPYEQSMIDLIRGDGATSSLILISLPQGNANFAFAQPYGTPINNPLTDPSAINPYGTANPMGNNNLAFSLHEYNTSDNPNFYYHTWDSNLPLMANYTILMGEWCGSGELKDDVGGNNAQYIYPLMTWAINYHVVPFLFAYADFFDFKTDPDHSWLYHQGSPVPLANYRYNGEYEVIYDLPWMNASNFTNAAPTSSFTVNQTNLPPGRMISTTQTCTGYPINYTWNWGDGTYTNIKIGNLSSYERSTSPWQGATHTYNTTGLYNVNLTASNNKGAATSTNTLINVSTYSISTPVPTVMPTLPAPVAIWSGNNFSGWSATKGSFNKTTGQFTPSTTNGPHIIQIHLDTLPSPVAYSFSFNVSKVDNNLLVIGRDTTPDINESYDERYAVVDLSSGTVARQASNNTSHVTIKPLDGNRYNVVYNTTYADSLYRWLYFYVGAAYSSDGLQKDEMKPEGSGTPAFQLYNGSITEFYSNTGNGTTVQPPTQENSSAPSAGIEGLLYICLGVALLPIGIGAILYWWFFMRKLKNN